MSDDELMAQLRAEVDPLIHEAIGFEWSLRHLAMVAFLKGALAARDYLHRQQATAVREVKVW